MRRSVRTGHVTLYFTLIVRLCIHKSFENNSQYSVSIQNVMNPKSGPSVCLACR